MKINEVEQAVGITKKNIRFYEEQGLLQPRRTPNGYRDYGEAEVERLRRIKLLRKLDVPLAEIRPMLDGQRTVADGMRRHAIELESRRKSLEAAMDLCRALSQTPGTLAQLDVDEALQELERHEKEGVRFVNVEKTDTKALMLKGALLGAGIFIVLMLFIIALLLWANAVDPEVPVWLMTVLVGLPAASIVAVVVVLMDRIREIRKGEEDAYRDY